MTVKDYLTRYYESYDEDGRLTSKIGMVEYLTTMQYIERYLTPNAKIAEIGAGTGRYSHALAQRGYPVDAVELVAHNIDVFNSHTKPDEPVTITQGNAVDLSFLKDNTYDVTLLLGPMYHLFTKEEQVKALSEAIRITKQSGVIFVAYCMADATVLTYGFVRGMIEDIITKCMVDPQTFETYSKPWDLFELYRKEDIEALRGGFNVTPLHFVATDGYTHHMRETVTAMSDEQYQLYLQYHLATCERQDMIGISHHTLDIFRKE